MKRRSFVHSLLIVPAASVAAQQSTPPPPAVPQAAAQPVVPPPAPPVRRFQGVTHFEMTEVDSAADTVTGFFTSGEFSTLTRLSALLVPSMKGNPGAVEAHAPEFLDFLIGHSPASTQQLYRHGLAELNVAAHKHFHKTFSELDTQQADSIVRPLLVVRAWEKTLPSDPMKHFIAQAHDDIRTATMNSREWADSPTASRRGRFNQGKRMYWKPVDPRAEV